MKTLYYIFPLLAGIAISIQAGINGQLRTVIQHPLMAALISFLVGTAALVILVMLGKQPLPPLQVFGQVSWYKWTGGLLGAFIVTVTIISVAKISAADMFVIFVAGQLVTALIMDHFGILGMNPNPVSAQKLIGITLVIAGAYLVNKK